MKLVVTEKNDAATKIAALLGVKKPKADKVYSTPVYRFEVDGEEWVTIGLRGHILEPDFTPTLIYKKRGGWRGVTAQGEAIPAQPCHCNPIAIIQPCHRVVGANGSLTGYAYGLEVKEYLLELEQD